MQSGRKKITIYLNVYFAIEKQLMNCQKFSEEMKAQLNRE
jgi:hypothetical protein